MEASVEKPKMVNGINTDQLFKTIDLIKEKLDIAKFKFWARKKWLNGTHSRASVRIVGKALESRS